MTVSLYTFIELFDRALATAEHLLDKGAAHAAAQGVDEAKLMDWRLIDDMQPLGFQLMVVVNFSSLWPARVADVAAPAAIGPKLSVEEFKTAIAEARRFLASLTPSQFEGVDDKPLTFQITETMEPTLPAERWLTVFATSNIYFHLSTAYGILRSKGVAIGKVDLFPRGF